MPRILLVDDDRDFRFAVARFFERRGFEVDAASSSEECVRSFRATPPDAVLLDHQLGPVEATDLLPVLRQVDPEVPILILTGHGSIELAVRAIKEGADQFFTKPVDLAALLVAVNRSLENRRNRQRLAASSAERARKGVNPFSGTSQAIRRLEDLSRRVLDAESHVLLEGETGSGKGVLATWLHDNGPRAEEPFVDLNCAGLSRELLESEIFGHEKGAFTGAAAAKAGLLEMANRGTLFLDELGDMEPAVQPKLLKAIEEKRFRRLGSTRDSQVDVRIIAATHRDLQALVDEGRFREDLYFRVSALVLRVPPLRERPEDIPVLAEQLLRAVAGHTEIAISPEALEAMKRHSWPGNVREMRNVLERAALFRQGSVIDTRDLDLGRRRAARPADPAPADTSLTLAEMERRYIERVMEEEKGRVSAAAGRLAIPRSSLYYKLSHYGIKVPRPRQH